MRIGVMLAMGMLLQQMGKRADLVTADRLPPVYRGLPGAGEIHTVMRVHESIRRGDPAGVRWVGANAAAGAGVDVRHQH